VATRGAQGRYTSAAIATAAVPAINGVAGGPVSGRSLPDPGASLAGQAPYDAQSPAAGAMDDVLARDPVYGHPATTQQDGAGTLPPYIGRNPAPVGVAAGSYALNDARDLGAPTDTPERGLPGLVGGVYDYTARLHNAGDQAFGDRIVQDGRTYVDYQPAPWWGDDRPAGR